MLVAWTRTEVIVMRRNECIQEFMMELQGAKGEGLRMSAKFLGSVVIDDWKIGVFGREIQMDLEAKKKTLVEDVGGKQIKMH